MQKNHQGTTNYILASGYCFVFSITDNKQSRRPDGLPKCTLYTCVRNLKIRRREEIDYTGKENISPRFIPNLR